MNPFIRRGRPPPKYIKTGWSSCRSCSPFRGLLSHSFLSPAWLTAHLASTSLASRTPQSRGEEAVSKAALYRGWSSTLGCPRWSGAQLGSHTSYKIYTTGIAFAMGHAVSLSTVWKTPGKCPQITLLVPQSPAVEGADNPSLSLPQLRGYHTVHPVRLSQAQQGLVGLNPAKACWVPPSSNILHTLHARLT